MKIFGKELLFNNNKVYHTGSKPTPSEIGAAASSHTHNYAGASSAGGSANSAVKLATARTISATGHATGSVSFDGSANVSMALTLANSGATAGSYGPTANATTSFGGTISIPQLTVDAKGRVTSAVNRTITMPTNPNSDTKVTNTLATTTKAYITGTTSSSTNTGTQVFDTGVYLDTTAGMLTATTFKGSLSGNATTATTLKTARTINGTSFNGSANITTAKWGTARTVTLNGVISGSASIDGSANVTITAAANDITTITKSLKATTEWMNTGISGNNLKSGTYAIQMYIDAGPETGQYQETYSGIMSWHSGTTNSDVSNEIILHQAGHAPNDRYVYLRTKRTAGSDSNPGYLYLQIATSQDFSTAVNVTFKFKKLI